MEKPALLALDAINRAISNLALGLPVQGHTDGKSAELASSNDLDAGNGFAARPFPYRLKTLFPQSRVTQSDSFGFGHASNNTALANVSRVPRIETTPLGISTAI
jgi:hypothetical protein